MILRSASFIALFQAAGMALFLALFGGPLEHSASSLQRIVKLSVSASAVLLLGQYALEAARMADDLSGMMDPSLQLLAMRSASSTVLAQRLLGLALVALAARGRVGSTLSVLGVGLVAFSFALTGHTVANPLRWALAPLLILHVMIVAFWFGALVPLYVICVRETPAIAARVTESFSKVALWWVPGILAAGALLVLILIRHLADFREGYGLSILAKFLGFAALMGLAALNKWRLGPAIAKGDARAVHVFRRSLVAEYGLMAVVLSVTAVMTTLYSPEP